MTRPLVEPQHLEAARRAQDEFRLCDACLGRRFAKVETGFMNAERGRIVREAAELREVATADCFLCEGLLDDLDELAAVALSTLAPYEHRHFLVGTKFDATIEAREAEVNAALGTAATAERINSEVNREVGKRVAAQTGKPVEFKEPDVAVVVDTRFFDASLQFGSLFIYGRYRKLARDIPQTWWPCRRCQGRGCTQCHLTGKQYQTSVQELVAAPFLEATGATESAFHGAGREDIDARTLGRGRPFVLELKDPRVRGLDLAGFPGRVVQASDGRVEIDSLRFTHKSEVAAIKEHRGSKTYRALVRLPAGTSPETLIKAVASLRGRAIHQRTPQRVEHRRADLVRERTVLGIEVVSHEGDVAVLEVNGDAGLYIKELVSGDEGRTEPSLAGLLQAPTKVEELDIVDVEYEEPVDGPLPSP